MGWWVDSAHFGDPHSLLVMGTIFAINVFFSLTKNATQQIQILYVSRDILSAAVYPDHAPDAHNKDAVLHTAY